MVTAKRMSEIYINRAHRSSLREVRGILNYFKGCEKVTAYWAEVLSYLEARFPVTERLENEEA